MRKALDEMKKKKIKISKQEYSAATIAILLHDIGHGPFSHALEHSIIKGLDHEDMSLALMNYLNDHFQGRLSLAIEIFEGAEELLKEYEYEINSTQVLSLSYSSGCSAYDCEFVNLAKDLNIPLITQDKKVLHSFPETAKSMDKFLKQ